MDFQLHSLKIYVVQAQLIINLIYIQRLSLLFLTLFLISFSLYFLTFFSCFCNENILFFIIFLNYLHCYFKFIDLASICFSLCLYLYHILHHQFLLFRISMISNQLLFLLKNNLTPIQIRFPSQICFRYFIF